MQTTKRPKDFYDNRSLNHNLVMTASGTVYVLTPSGQQQRLVSTWDKTRNCLWVEKDNQDVFTIQPTESGPVATFAYNRGRHEAAARSTKLSHHEAIEEGAPL